MMKKILLLMFTAFLALNFTYSQTTYAWRNDQGSAATGQWNVANNWWNGAPALPGGGEILFLDGIVGQWMTNDLPSTNRFRIFLGSGGAARSITGVITNTFFDFGGQIPKIENNSSDALGLSIDFPIVVGHTSMEINPTDGPIAFSKLINNDGNDIAVWGDNGKVLGIGLGLSGSGGLSINQNSTVSFFVTPVTYSGTTTLNAGVLDLQVSAANTDITVKSGAKLSINGANVTVKSITVDPGGIVEVLAGKSLTVTNNLSNSGTVTLMSDATGKPAGNPTGSLIVSGTATGTIVIQRNIDGHSNVADAGWHYLSSPVDNFVVGGSDFEPGANDDLYYYDESADYWINWKAGGGSTDPGFAMLKEKGYLCSYESTEVKEFSGTINNVDVPVAGLTNTAGGTGSEDGWNLIGNPFTSAVQWNNGSWGISDIAAIAKVYPTAAGNWEDIDLNEFIPAMNGFFVQVTAATGGLTVPKSARGHDATVWYKAEEESIELKVSGGANSFYDISRVRFNEEATDEYDSEFDSHKLYGMATAPQLFTRIGDEVFSTNTFTDANAGRELDMNFIPGTSGEYTIEILENSVANVYLEDLVTDQIIDISTNSTYTFNAEVGDNQNRFQLLFGVTGIEDIESSNLQAYMSGQNLMILGEEGQADLSIFDIQGKQIVGENIQLTSDYRKLLSLPSGVYVVRVQTSEFVKTNKIIIK